MASLRCCSTTTAESSSRVAECNKATPLGPLYFCCGINGLVNEIQKLNPVYNKWYMDDGGIIGDVETLQQAWKIIQERGPEMGLYLNPSKCEWTWLDPECKDLCPIQLKGVAAEDQVKLVPHDHIEMLGVPLGSVKFNSEFVEKKLMKRLSRTVTALSEFEDSQAAFYLLRVSYSIVRAVHFMRTTPLEHWRDHAKSFDKLMRKAVETILGTPLPEHSYKQSCLTPKLGGMGMRKVEEHADVAFHASWHEARLTSKEEGWTPPAGVPAEYTPQAVASFKIDEKAHSELVRKFDQAKNPRDSRRLLRCAQPHASGFVTAVPSKEDGDEAIHHESSPLPHCGAVPSRHPAPH